MTLEIAETRLLIGGDRVDGADGETLDVESPSTRQTIARVARATAADVARAVTAAETASPAWAATSAAERADLLLEVARRLGAEQETLAQLMASENGNAVRTQARPEAGLASAAFRYFAGAARELKGETTYLRANTLDYTRRMPLGVVGAIVPWNSPIALSVLKIAPAIAAGNTIVLKGAQEAPLSVLHMAAVCADVLPPGVVNAIVGPGTECGTALVNDSRVAKISFTGSTAVGRTIMAGAAARIARVTLELGGKSAQIVLPDVDLDAAADGAVAAMRMTRQGQSCSAGSRLFVHDDIAEDFLDRLIDRLDRLVVGDPLEESTDMGAIVSPTQLASVDALVERARRAHPGALRYGGGAARVDGLQDGLFYQPTVFCDLPEDAELMRREIFGPVLAVSRWNDDTDVLRRANDTEYGLAGFVWGRDIQRTLRIAHGLHAGFVQVNQGGGQLLGHSYGGMKQSGLGREGSLEGMLEGYTQYQQLSVQV